ncbi:uncharacterized protein EDB91DRAFT_1254659 [Suillus paluster]|uniref:uncharacterized protein n=1 Tax=Suillus paluster TaxID=48578 RepID=UPI001B85B9FA|nr:uncharacterized protein EDB91DRAFT_1254659 [Suillus paluster]KAG1725721.1 hypothetical protein EDB91DRAFT_1254659 [Suillus paluster]
MKKLHEFLWSLIDAASVHPEQTWANVIQRFIWFKALRRDANFYESTDLAPDLAKLKYFVNNACIVHALWYQKHSLVPQFERVIAVHREVLALGRPTTFNMLFEFQQYASSLAWNQQREPRVFFDPDYQWIIVGRETLYLSRFRHGIQSLLDQIEDRYLLLTRGRIMMHGLPDHVADDMTNSIRGHSFVNDVQFDPLKLQLFFHLVDIHRLAMLDRDGRLAWDIPAVKDILRRTGDIWKPLYHLLYITSQISTRGVQFLQHQIANADRHRNIFLQGQELIILSGYSKTSHISDRDSCTPAFVHSKLARWMVEFLAGGLRHAESLLAYVAYGATAHHEYNTFLVMDDGRRINPDQWYSIFLQVNREQFQCAWGVRDFRHGAIAMAREFISLNHAFSLADDLLAESADHSTQIDHIHYGNLHGAIPQLTNNVMEKHRLLSEEWQLFCGLGPGHLHHPLITVDPLPSTYPPFLRPVSTSTAAALKTYLQDNLVPLLRDIVAQDVLPSILDTLRKTTQNSAPAPAIQLAIGTALHAPVEPQGPPPQEIIAPQSTPLSCIETEDADIKCIDMDEFYAQRPAVLPPQSCPIPYAVPDRQKIRLPAQPSSSARLHEKTKSPAQSSFSPSSLPAPPTVAVHHKRPLHPDSSSRSNPREELVRSAKRIRLATSYPDAADLRIKEETDERPVVLVASSSQAEDQLLEDDEDDDRAVPREASSSQPDDLMSMDEDEEIEILPHFSPEEDDRWTQRVRDAFRTLFKDPAAKERSPAQCKAIINVMTAKKDTFITLKTGGGKSALWMTAPLIDPGQRCIVICPFVVLLEEQVEKCLQLGLRAHNFTKDKNVPADVHILFVQVESASSKAFQEFLASPQGRSFTKVFIDEHHDFLVCHPERKEQWTRLAAQFSKWPMQINLLSATSPPSSTSAYLKGFSIQPEEALIYRTCTDRPEIGFHVLNILPHHFNASLKSLVCALQLKMAGSDRMLVFFNSNKEADNFSSAMGCAVFHSDLPTIGGNTKTHNLARWDRGETNIMTCTTAFAQGVDRSSVRFVVISEVEYGLLVVNQMSGRSGRDGREAHTFYLTQKTSLSAFQSDQDHHCIKGLDDVLFSDHCRRYTSIKCMDGKGFAYRCKDRSDVVQCDVCDPASDMQRMALQAIKESPQLLRPQSTRAPTFPVPSSSRPSQTSSSIPSSSLDDDALFGKFPKVTPKMEIALNAMEATHAPLGHRFPMELPSKGQGARLVYSQPPASKASKASKAPAPSSSLPVSLPSSSSRSDRVMAGIQSRLNRTSLLDRFMRKLQNCCPVHFAVHSQAHPEHGPCALGRQGHDSTYSEFKNSFVFERYTYCFNCALPQNYKHNNEQPSCHSAVSYRTGGSCPFAGFIFKAVHCLWNSGEAMVLAGTLGIHGGWNSFQEFISWVNKEEKEQGRYINLLEIFIAFCNKLESSQPRFFL